MVASVMMVVLSVALLVLWFHYTCDMLLTAKPARDYRLDVAEANELRFPEVQQDLRRASSRLDLDKLQEKLEMDYRTLCYLVRHGAAFRAGNDAWEQRMLMIQFHLLKSYNVIAGRFSAANRRRVVQQMAVVIACFANIMGERAAYSAAH